MILNKSGVRTCFGLSRLGILSLQPITDAVTVLRVQLVNVFYDQLNGYQILKECMSWKWIRLELVDITSVQPDDVTLQTLGSFDSGHSAVVKEKK